MYIAHQPTHCCSNIYVSKPFPPPHLYCAKHTLVAEDNLNYSTCSRKSQRSILRLNLQLEGLFCGAAQ